MTVLGRIVTFVVSNLCGFLTTVLLFLLTYNEPNPTVQTVLRLLVLSFVWRLLEELSSIADDVSTVVDASPFYQALIGTCSGWYFPLLLVPWLHRAGAASAASLLTLISASTAVMFVFLFAMYTFPNVVAPPQQPMVIAQQHPPVQQQLPPGAAEQNQPQRQQPQVAVAREQPRAPQRSDSFFSTIFTTPIVALLQAYLFSILVRTPLLSSCAAVDRQVRKVCPAAFPAFDVKTTLHTVPLPTSAPFGSVWHRFDVLRFDDACVALNSSIDRFGGDGVDDFRRLLYVSAMGVLAVWSIWIALLVAKLAATMLLPSAIAQSATYAHRYGG